MITRPLDLASHLRPEPRNFDALFLVNGGLIALFFMLFASRFVLAPGLGVDFRVPEMPGARAGAATATSVISVKRAGLIFAAPGALNLPQLRVWLREQALAVKSSTPPVLLVRVNASVPMSDLMEIYTAAQEAGFQRIILGADEPAAKPLGR